MTQERAVVIREDRQVALQELETRFAMAVRQRELLERYIRDRLKPDKHFYTVGDEPGRKPSLTKEGAELICLPHALKGHYFWLFGPENPPLDDAPYQITIKAELEANGNFAGEGIGSASSMITKKTGERVQRQKDPGLRHNATVKMASKSAYIAATLNSTAASEFFTQDLEDDQTGGADKHESKGQKCPIHNKLLVEGPYGPYCQTRIKNEKGKEVWCKGVEDTVKKQTVTEAPVDPEKMEQEVEELWPEGKTESKGETPPFLAESDTKTGLDFDPEWLRESLAKVHWMDATVKSYLTNICKVAGEEIDTSGKIVEVISRLTRQRREAFIKEIQNRLEMA